MFAGMFYDGIHRNRTAKIGEVAMTIRVASSEFISGTVFLCCGVGFMIMALEHRLGTASEMGPGYFPLILSLFLIAVGFSLMVRAFFISSVTEVAPRLRPILMIMLGLVGFSLLVRPLGFPAAVFAGTLTSAYGGDKFRWTSGLLLSCGLAIFCTVVFVKGLGLPFPVLGSLIHR